ncbi:ABC transporter substrate-binding protein [Capillimicrobium parvum]|uniref:Formylaminopyrimidine-binding protein n=1 Tax=Capillimicrobium parvum TaxID=2884022 RepID=A0A9E6Y0L0_9ACTN|nr:ABC transporter substrate-binding protein [Capillimicrobium parvum]UGS37982.1 Formylaminopyrimidine-binding protein [Capillimicrobium parvum]
MLRRIAVLAVLAASLLGLAACGEKDDRVSAPPVQKVRLMLDYLPNADHAGIYEAIADGSFARAGLNVEPLVPPDPSAPLKLLAAGRADIAISYEPEVLLARDKGLKVVSIGALVQRPLTSIMALPSAKVTTPKDLRGKTVGTAGIPYQSAYLKTILAENGVPQTSVKEVNVSFNLVPAMLSKRADATLGAFWNVEGVQLQREKRNPVIIPVDQAGVPTYNELVLVVREQDARARGPYLRAFVRALAQGHEALRKNPQAGVDALVERNPDLDPATTLAQVRATLPAFFPTDKTKPFGWQDVDAWGRYGRWMLDNQLLAKAPLPTSLTNEYLPGVGLEQDEGPPS